MIVAVTRGTGLIDIWVAVGRVMMLPRVTAGVGLAPVTGVRAIVEGWPGVAEASPAVEAGVSRTSVAVSVPLATGVAVSSPASGVTTTTPSQATEKSATRPIVSPANNLAFRVRGIKLASVPDTALDKVPDTFHTGVFYRKH